MEEFTYIVELTTIEGIADSSYLDRLAEVVYDLPLLVDPYLALEPNGAVSASFCVEGPDPLQAAQRAIEEFAHAATAAGPLRLPQAVEEGRGKKAIAEALAEAAAATVSSFAVKRAEDRKKVLA
jgi:hypothetical protein